MCSSGGRGMPSVRSRQTCHNHGSGALAKTARLRGCSPFAGCARPIDCAAVPSNCLRIVYDGHMGRRRLHANKTERQRAWRRRKREREALNPSPVVRYVEHAELRTLAAICDRGCSRLRMEAKPWMLGAVDASRAFELLRHIQSELNRLAG
jgi:hypothetical protein